MTGRLTRRGFLAGGTAAVATAGIAGRGRAGEAGGEFVVESDYLRLAIGREGLVTQFVDRASGTNYAAPGAPVAAVVKSGKEYPATAAEAGEGRVTLAFGDAKVTATLRATGDKGYLLFEVAAVEGEGVEELRLVDIPLVLKAAADEPFAACALALNLRTKVSQLPRPTGRLRASCYPRFGMVGARVAILGCPADRLREAMQQAVSDAPELPQSPIGGPWAWGQPINQGSYLFNFSNMSEETVDRWIDLAHRLGMNQIDFHGGTSFRFGDCLPNPETYPGGAASLKAVIDKLHAAGIKAGLHTYAFFIDKRCPWVTPRPDPRLAKAATLTLAEALSAESDQVVVNESTAGMLAVTGFFVRNSATVQIDDELIVYRGVNKEPPYGFSGCQRGAYGTQAAAHAPGAKVHHLKECFGLFVPEAESSLLAEVAGKTAEIFNACGFDMIYLDALDGEDVLGGAENGWHYGSRFTFEIWKRLERPALMEMSTFHHHLWYVRSRMGAWDHSTRSHKRFIDIHCQANEANRQMFLPSQLGWWAFKTWTGPQGEPTFSDDIEYLMAKCLGNDTGFALMGIDPDTVDATPALPRLADIIRRYEDLRHSGQVPERIKAELRKPGAEFRLIGNLKEGWYFERVQYARHRVEGLEGVSNAWTLENRFALQPLTLRIESLMTAGPYAGPGNTTLGDFADGAAWRVSAAQTGVSAQWQAVAAETAPGPLPAELTPTAGTALPLVRYSATNSRPSSAGAWCKVETTFSPPLNLSGQQGLGVWVCGDGQGEVLNVQLKSPAHVSHADGEHYIAIDFTGWRYFELIEPEGERYAQYQWPYGNIYSIYRESVNYSKIETLALWYNNLPPGKEAACYLAPVRAVPLATGKLVRPTVAVGGKTVTFPAELESGQYLEYFGSGDCKLYGPKGELVREVMAEGDAILEAGGNRLEFHCEAPAASRPRAQVTVIAQGERLIG